MESWYKLDNAAKLFPAVTSEKNTSVFRVAVILKEPVDGFVLQQAVERCIPRFPMFFFRLRKGVFWNYFEENDEPFSVLLESGYPCGRINPLQSNGYFVSVLYGGCRISVEFFHALTDGGGGMEFLKTLTYTYLTLKGYSIDHENMIIMPDSDASEAEMEDSFLQYFKKDAHKLLTTPKACRISGTNFDIFGNNVTTAVVSASALNSIAKAQGATITAYLAALLVETIFSTRQKYLSVGNRPIVVAVPCNLRRLFPSKTLRNFFGMANLGMVVKRDTSFEDILQEMTKQLKDKTTNEALEAMIAKNINTEKPLYSRGVPLFIKRWFIEMGFKFMGEVKKTISLSNLGNTLLPTQMKPFVEHMEAILYPTTMSPVNCGVSSVNDRLAISFSSSIKERDIVKTFFRRLSSLLPVEVYSNDWGRQLATSKEKAAE